MKIIFYFSLLKLVGLLFGCYFYTVNIFKSLLNYSKMTKIDLLKKALQENDKNNAILLAFKLPVHLGQDLKKTVDLATQCIKNPSFYRSVGTDIEQSINVAFEGLKTKILV